MEAILHFILTFPQRPLESQFAWLLSTTLLFALIKGRWVERAMAIGLIASFYACHQIYIAAPQSAETMRGMVVADVCLLAFALPFALWADRYWPMWMFGALTMLVLIDFVFMIQKHPSWLAFLNSSALWSEIILIILGVGTYIEGMRRPKTRLPSIPFGSRSAT